MERVYAIEYQYFEQFISIIQMIEIHYLVTNDT
jgi:hypothetical protein